MCRFHCIACLNVLTLALFATGCGPSAAARLQGKWELDITKGDVGKSIDEAAANQANPLAGMMAGALKDMAKNIKLEFEFKPAGVVTMQGSVMGMSQSKTGTWKVVKASGDEVTISGKLDGDTTDKETKIKFVDNDTIEMIPPAGGQNKTAVFRRVKKT